MILDVPMCDLCRRGMGGECHTPGCALWMNRAPDHQIQYDDAALADRTSPREMLAEFHDALGDRLGRGNADLRMTLHKEEHDELIEALWHCKADERSRFGVPRRDRLMALARELADVVYVAYGTAHAFDIDLDEALREIHRAAMDKVSPPNGVERVVREDGKICKPEGFVPPDMTAAVR